jgi:hypothetical protein
VPKDNIRDVIEEHKESVCQTLLRITRSVLGYYPGGVSPSGAVGTLVFLNDSPVPLYDRAFGLHFSQRYDCLQASAGEQLWEVNVRGYIYQVCQRRGDGWREILSYHWHPELQVPFPHLHFKQGERLVTKAHLPTGHVSIKSVVESLIQDFGITSDRTPK